MGELEFTLLAQEALAYAGALRLGWVVPLHFEGWRHFSESREQAVGLFGKSKFARRTRWLSRGDSAKFAV